MILEKKGLILLFKAVGLILLAVFSKIFFEIEQAIKEGKPKSHITFALIATRITMASFVFIGVYTSIVHYFDFSENLNLMIGAMMGFAGTEYLNVLVTVPSMLKDKIFDIFKIDK